MAPPARHPAAQPARRNAVAKATVSPRHEARQPDEAERQLDWWQPALAIWLRDDAGPSVRMGDVHPTDGR